MAQLVISAPVISLVVPSLAPAMLFAVPIAAMAVGAAPHPERERIAGIDAARDGTIDPSPRPRAVIAVAIPSAGLVQAVDERDAAVDGSAIGDGGSNRRRIRRRCGKTKSKCEGCRE